MTDSVVNSADTDSGKVSAVSKKQLRRWRKYLAEERLEADTYRYLARRRSGDEREVLQELSIAEERHEQYWLNLLGEDALPTPGKHAFAPPQFFHSDFRNHLYAGDDAAGRAASRL
ncbi:MAG: hypothetical protein ACLS7Q_06040 [Varibaculum cambriense]